MQSIKGEASGNLHTLDYFYGEYWFGKRVSNQNLSKFPKNSKIFYKNSCH